MGQQQRQLGGGQHGGGVGGRGCGVERQQDRSGAPDRQQRDERVERALQVQSDHNLGRGATSEQVVRELMAACDERVVGQRLRAGEEGQAVGGALGLGGQQRGEMRVGGVGRRRTGSGVQQFGPLGGVEQRQLGQALGRFVGHPPQQRLQLAQQPPDRRRLEQIDAVLDRSDDHIAGFAHRDVQVELGGLSFRQDRL